MKIDVILLANVPELGQQGSVKHVSIGYYKHFLLPKKLAKPATSQELALMRQQSAAQEKKRASAKSHLHEIAAALQRTILTFSQKADDTGKLFGSLSAKDIAKELNRQKFSLSEKNIVLSSPLKTIGEFQVPIALDDEISAPITVVIKKS